MQQRNRLARNINRTVLACCLLAVRTFLRDSSTVSHLRLPNAFDDNYKWTAQSMMKSPYFSTIQIRSGWWRTIIHFPSAFPPSKANTPHNGVPSFYCPLRFRLWWQPHRMMADHHSIVPLLFRLWIPHGYLFLVSYPFPIWNQSHLTHI